MTNSETILNGGENWLAANNGHNMLQPMRPQFGTVDTPPTLIETGAGVHIWDTDGNKFLDCQAGLWCVNTGYGREEINKAITDQLSKIAYYTTFNDSANVPSVQLAALLCEVAQPENIKRVMFSSGGSDAVESALKIARQYWKIENAPERVKFLSLKNGYHGLHFGGMSAGGGVAWKRNYEPMLPGFFQTETPDVYRNPYTSDPEELVHICLSDLEREINYQSPDTIAAVIAEPIQGAGGVIVPPASFWPGLREICDRHGILLISDEVVTGLGRSGTLFGARGWGVKPDIMTMAKGLTSGYLPLGATLINERVSTAMESKDSPHNVFMHGYTYSGHPVACAAALASVKLTLQENLTENAANVGAYMLEQLHAQLDDLPSVGNVRGKGLMAAVEMVKDKKTKEPYGPMDEYPKKVAEICRSNGIMVRSLVNKFIISPPLIFTHENVDTMVGTLREALSHPAE